MPLLAWVGVALVVLGVAGFIMTILMLRANKELTHLEIEAMKEQEPLPGETGDTQEFLVARSEQDLESDQVFLFTLGFSMFGPCLIVGIILLVIVFT